MSGPKRRGRYCHQEYDPKPGFSLREARLLAGLTVYEMAERCGYRSAMSITQVETGRQAIPARIVAVYRGLSAIAEVRP